jgi:hypothetical protein
MQIVGKIRMALFPKTNHWWHVPLYVSCRGLTTRPVPFGDRLFEINFDFIDHCLSIVSSDGQSAQFRLNNLSVASFYRQIMQALHGLGIEVQIKATPYDVPFSDIPFAQDKVHASYAPDWIEKYFQLLAFVNNTFEIFRGRFIGKSTPVHLFWHHADLALTRFSGKSAPSLSQGSAADKEAYSHEVISFGFWAGDDITRQPAFYAYVYPEPDDLIRAPLLPSAASWRTDYGYTMAFLPYDMIRSERQPRETLLEFLESAYQACAGRAGWDIQAFTRE